MKRHVRRWSDLLLTLVAIGSVPPEVSGQTTDLRGVARSAGRPAADTVVWLEAPDAPPPPATPPRALLDQRNLSFVPRVLVVRAGTLVDFPNNDRVFHNVFSFRDGQRFDLGLYPVGARRRVAFDRPGLSRVFCNIHPNMAAYVMTVDSPYFARSDDAGAFTITGVPVGTYTYHAWRPGAVEELTGTWASPDGALSITWP
jgi:plastocyanin